MEGAVELRCDLHAWLWVVGALLAAADLGHQGVDQHGRIGMGARKMEPGCALVPADGRGDCDVDARPDYRRRCRNQNEFGVATSQVAALRRDPVWKRDRERGLRGRIEKLRGGAGDLLSGGLPVRAREPYPRND